MANSSISKTFFTYNSDKSKNDLKIKAKHFDELDVAISALDNYVKNVDNCGVTNCCQSCQNTCACQSCQSCQNSCSCQSQCNCNCSSCFIAGTSILLSSGKWINIEDVKVGMMLRSTLSAVRVERVEVTRLGDLRSIYKMSDESLYFSGEHMLWVKDDSYEGFGVMDYNQHLREEDETLYKGRVGMHLSKPPIPITRSVQFGTVDGWTEKILPVVDRSFGFDTKLYRIVTSGDHMM